MERPPARCAIYTRQSVARSGSTDFTSCDAQREACVEFVRARALEGWVPLEERFDDLGESGATIERPALARLLDRITESAVDRVVVHRLDRLTRSVADYAELVGTLKRRGVQLSIVVGDIHMGDVAMSDLTLNLLATFAEFEREIIGERLRDARAALRSRGLRNAGRIPYGYSSDPLSHQLVLEVGEAPVVKRMFEMAAAGTPPSAIAMWINSLSHDDRHVLDGRAPWSPKAVLRVLGNRVYLGRMGAVADAHDAIVDEELFAKARASVDVRRTRTPGRRAQETGDPFLLRQLLRCVYCGRLMTTSSSRALPEVAAKTSRRKPTLPPRYYRCRGERACRGTQVAADDIEERVLAWLRKPTGPVSPEAQFVLSRFEPIWKVLIPQVEHALVPSSSGRSGGTGGRTSSRRSSTRPQSWRSTQGSSGTTTSRRIGRSHPAQGGGGEGAVVSRHEDARSCLLLGTASLHPADTLNATMDEVLQTRTNGQRRPELPASREQLLEAIVREEARLATIETERANSKQRLAVLRAELASLGAEPEIRVHLPLAADTPVPRTSADKVKLFRSLFRGREDVFPTRFVAKKTGKPGYAPACRNKFVKGVCDLPKVKCGECPNQAFVPFDDAAVVGHLTGRHVMGVYPLLEDETCWFLAVDFDKSTWTEDVSAFAETCRRVGVPAAIERSRSGNGAHVWFFFSSPVPATSARKMGCYLITETMSWRHQLSMESYDRLFPSQDTMPRGGFGNLIALPLQHEPRQQGNSVFLDDQLRSFPDDQQWAYLASVPRIDPETVETIAREAARQGAVVGVRMAETTDEEDATPWARLPSRKPKPLVITELLPPVVRAVLAQKLFVEKAGLPSPLINQIKRLAAFQNPEFYKKQSMRLSTATTPRVIACAEDLPQFVGLPRGRHVEVEALLRGYGVSIKVDDQRAAGEPLRYQFQGALTPVQEKAAAALLREDIGVFVAPPGVGKTVVGTYLVAERGCSTLILVHRRPLLDQWLAQLSLFLGIEPKEIGQIGGGKKTGNGKLDVAMIQSLVRKDKVQDSVANYGQVIVDECHHLPAVSFERVLAEAKARYVVGLTATPQRRDGHHPITEMQLGPVRFAVDPKSQAAQRPFAHKLIVRETGFKTPKDKVSIQELYAALAADEKRNQLILDDVIRALEDGRSPILLTERKDQLEYFAARLARLARHLVVLQGGMGTKERREVKERLAAIPDGEERLILATGRYIGEGFDDARLDTLFLAMPVSWKGTLIQYTGRLHRLHPAKKEVRIFDYVDREVPMLLRMFEKRLRGYRGIGYAKGEAPLGLAEPGDDVVVEYDEDVLRSLKEMDDFA